MAYSSNPTTANPVPDTPESNGGNTKMWYIILIVALIGTWGYLFYDKTKSNRRENELRIQVETTDSLRSAVQMQFDAASKELDAALGQNTQLQGTLAQQKAEIDRLKNEIQSEINNKNGDLSRARALIEELRGKVTNLVAQIEVLRKQNVQLATANQSLTLRNDTLAQEKVAIADTLITTRTEKARIEDEASTLHISEIQISPISVARSGKESQTSRASKADYLRVSFTIDENRVASSGPKSLYVIVTDPDGNAVSSPAMGSGTFTTRQNGEKVFTKQLTVNYTTGESLPVSFNWSQQNSYKAGTYHVEIYHNGYRIGNGNVSLRKGLF